MCADVARLVMGWVSANVPWAYDGVASLWHTKSGDPLVTVFSWRPDRCDTQNMQVLDRMTELGFQLVLTVQEDRTVAQFNVGGEPVAHSEDRDRRIALLRAALDAVSSPPNTRLADGAAVR